MISPFKSISGFLSSRKTQVTLTVVILVSILLSRIYMLKTENEKFDFVALITQVISTIILGVFFSFMLSLFDQIRKNGIRNINYSVAFDEKKILRIFIIYNLLTIPLTLYLYSNDFWILSN